MSWRGLLISGFLIVLSLSATMAQAQPEAYNNKPFALWLEEFKAEAVQHGIPRKLVDDAFLGVAPDDMVVKLDRKQPEDKISFSKYKTGVLNPTRITQGRALMQEYHGELAAISKTYHVKPQVIVALWGMETSYGANKGNFSLIESLATLAYEGRRAEFFRAELMNALEMLRDDRVLASAVTSSWAGAMGHCQFMPSSYLKYAVDWNGDGHRDIWNSVPDALASIANYLHSEGWNDNDPIGVAVMFPRDFTAADADLYQAKPIDYWQKRGITKLNGAPLTQKKDVKVYAMYPGTPDEGEYLVYPNYHILLKWNRSRYFATSVQLLADALAQ
jgi:membrane-bound lytic murein transglycosylase B